MASKFSNPGSRVDEQTISFFDNDLEVFAKELLFQCDTTDCLEKWGRTLTLKQLPYVLDKLGPSSDLSRQDQIKLFEDNYKLFKEEYLIAQFALFKSLNLIQTVFNETFGQRPPVATTDKFVQLLALYRFKKELLLRIYSFQKIQRRGGTVYDIVCKESSPTEPFDAFMTRQNVTNLIQIPSENLPFTFYCHDVQKTSNSIFLFLRHFNKHVFVAAPRSDTGGHGFGHEDIVIKFSLNCDKCTVYSKGKLSVKVAQYIAEKYLKASVKFEPVTNLISQEKVMLFVEDLLSKDKEGEAPYAVGIKFLPSELCENAECDLSIPGYKSDGVCLGNLAMRCSFSIKKLCDLRTLDVIFETHKVVLFFQYEAGKFAVSFSSQALSYEQKPRFQAWGSNTYDIALLPK
jgi:hypothetical protein